jgi:hypothetical protein
MITIGVLFLLDNLNVLPPLNWERGAALAAGAYLRRARRVGGAGSASALGTVLSLLVTAAAPLCLATCCCAARPTTRCAGWTCR